MRVHEAVRRQLLWLPITLVAHINMAEPQNYIYCQSFSHKQGTCLDIMVQTVVQK